jgi:hypothetical protein
MLAGRVSALRRLEACSAFRTNVPFERVGVARILSAIDVMRGGNNGD